MSGAERTVLTHEPLVGRETEVKAIHGLVASAAGNGGVMLVRGEVGLGKSALLAEAIAAGSAAGLRIVQVTGVRTEANVPFAGLHQLLRPMIAGLEQLPAPQRSALGAAFGLREGTAPHDPFLISLATLTLLTDMAGERPILAVVDDAHWLDRASDETLAFVARRLGSDPVVLLVAIREGETTAIEAAGLPVLTLGPLTDAAARELFDRRGRDLAPGVRDRIIREAAGNPLALVELPDAFAPGLEGGPIDTLPITTRIERAFAAQLVDLPTSTSTMLLVAAVDDQGSIDEIVAAARSLGVTDAGFGPLKPAIDARLIELDGEAIRFRHPLIRSAIAQRANGADLRAAHAALARVATDPDRIAWHMAAAATGRDEGIASLLDSAADRADRRGAIALAVSALEHAARLSPETQARGARLLRAADRAYALGRLDVIARVLRGAAPLDVPALEDRRRAWLQALELNGPKSAREGAHIRSVVDSAERAGADGDVGFAMSLLHLAAARCWWIEATPRVRARVTDVARRIAPHEDDPLLLHVLASSASEHGPEVIERLHRRWASDESIEPDDARTLATAALWVGDLELSRELFTASVDRQRAQGRLGFLARAQVMSGWSGLHLGMVAVVGPALYEGARLAAETDQGFFVAAGNMALASYHALRGDLAAAESSIAEAERAALNASSDGALAMVRQARGMVELAAGRSGEAFDQLRHVFEPGDPAYHTVIRSWAVSDLIDAAVLSGHAADVRPYLAALEANSGLMSSPWLQIGLEYARAVIAGDAASADVADDAFRVALQRDLKAWPLARARLLLAHGSWLRRQRRVAESRAPLRTAREIFDAMGVSWMGDRARRELGASGEVSRARGATTIDELTPQELQIARLAADGLSNRQIGERLYLSHRTVSFHLYHVYPKLGISARAQLHAALAPNLGALA